MEYVESKLRERHLDPTKYHVSWDEEVASFLLFNLSGMVVGYQNYRPDAEKTKNNDPRESRYYTYVTKPEASKHRHVAVWGLETYNYRKDILFVCEGIFDASMLHHLGLPAVAALSNDPKQLRPWLRATNRHVVCVCDGDAAGRKLAKMGHEAVILNDGEDLGDMTEENVKKTLDKWL